MSGTGPVPSVRVTLLFFAVAATLAGAVIYQSGAAARDFQQAYDQLTVSSPQDVIRVLAGKIRSFMGSAFSRRSTYESTAAGRQDVATLLEDGVKHRRQALSESVILVLISLAFILCVKVRTTNPAAVAGYVCGVSALWLVIGIAAPILTIAVHLHAPLLGNIVMRYDSKNVAAVAIALWRSGNISVAALLLVCGVILPVLKLLALWLALAFRGSPLSDALASVGRHLAPWAMADTLALAIVVAFLALGSEHGTQATLEVGAYFFAGHCVLAMLAARMTAQAE